MKSHRIIRPAFSPLIALLSIVFQNLTKAEDFNTYYNESQHWPFYIHVNDTLESHNSDTPVTLKPSIAGILLRLDKQDEKAVIDFGRKGVHYIDLDKTDFAARWKDFKDNKVTKKFPNLINTIGDKTYKFKTDYLGRIPPEHFDQFKTIALLYVDPRQDESKQLVSELHARYLKASENRQSEIIMLPNRNDLNELFLSTPFTWPTLTFQMSVGYYKALAHNPETLPCIVVCDKEGKVILHSLEDASIEDILQHLQL